MDADTHAIVELRVARANEELQAAQSLIREKFYRISTTRAYYAVFLVTTAILLTKDIARAKHSGVHSAFGQSFVKPAIIEKEYGRIFTRLRKTREDSDYNDRVRITEEIARERLADAEKFVARIEKYLRDSGVLP